MVHDGSATVSEVRRLGPALAFERLWEETGCRPVIEELAGERKHEFALERAAFLTVLHRLFAGGSDRAANRWREDYRIDDSITNNRVTCYSPCLRSQAGGRVNQQFSGQQNNRLPFSGSWRRIEGNGPGSREIEIYISFLVSGRRRDFRSWPTTPILACRRTSAIGSHPDMPTARSIRRA
jgi:hypothetical protein